MTDPILVPIQLQALLVNPNVRAQGFQRWSMDYSALADFGSPEPAPFSGVDPAWATDPANDGVHVQWTLPSALRRGVHDPATGVTTYPPVPNRWVVLRSWGPAAPTSPGRRASTGWVVESDYLGPDGTSAYLDPTARTPVPVRIGRILPLAGWTEGAHGPQFLTAVGPGNVAFAAFQPYGAGVFSFHDPAADLTEGDEVSYLVAGWYSDPASDVLAPARQPAGTAARLSELGWQSPGSQTATSTLFQGAIRTLIYSRTAVGARPTAAAVAVGNTSVDALTALITAQVAKDPNSTLHPGLIEAFHYDLLRTLDEVDGPTKLSARIHEAWFAARPGGSAWQVVDTPPADSVQAAQQEQGEGGPVEQPAWLDALNSAQAGYDALVRELGTAQRRLYELWWQRGRANKLPERPPGPTDAEFEAALNPANPTSQAGQVIALLTQVSAAQAKIPYGDTQDELSNAIAAYTQQPGHQLPAGTELKRSDLPTFRAAADPVVVIAGARAGAFDDDLGTDAAGLLPCRSASQTISGLLVPMISPPATDPAPAAQITDQMLTPDLPTANLPAIPQISRLIVELFLLDPVNAATLGARTAQVLGQPAVADEETTQLRALMTTGTGMAGTLPAIMPQVWTQPWAPLFLEWEVSYWPIPELSAWTFDGTGYTWSGNGASPGGPISLSGRSLLMPQPSFTFKARLDAFLANTPDADLTALESFVASVNGWDLLSQTLSGFNAQLSLRDPAGLPAPDATTIIQPPSTTIATLVGAGAVAMPMVTGAVSADSTAPVNGSGFQTLRAGQFAFTRLSVVDRFGQSVDVVGPANEAAYAPVLAEGLTPQTAFAGPAPTARYVQLPPRLLQYARWDFAFAAPIVGAASGAGSANPVCAWIVPSPLDGALACYDPSGNALGELVLTATAAGGTAVSWLAWPGSLYPDISTLNDSFPVLAVFLSGLQGAGPTAFADLLATIDSTLWTIDAPGTGDETYLAVMAGRPLALARASVHGEPATAPPVDPTLPDISAPPPTPAPGFTIPIRLGDASLRGDGLVGYLVEPDYGHFHAAYVPPGLTSAYVAPIGPGSFLPAGFGGADPAYVALLLDPKLPVHLASDILPVTTLQLPQRFVADAMAAMALNLRFGPVLTDVLQPAGDGPPAMVLPRPTELDGTWSWVEADGAAPAEFDVTPADSSARFPGTAPTVRTGWLRLTGGLKPGQELQQ